MDVLKEVREHLVGLPEVAPRVAGLAGTTGGTNLRIVQVGILFSLMAVVVLALALLLGVALGVAWWGFELIGGF